MKIKWNSKGRTKEYGKLSVPVESDLEIDKQWDGRHAITQAWIEGNRLYVLVKRDKRKETKHE